MFCRFDFGCFAFFAPEIGELDDGAAHRALSLVRTRETSLSLSLSRALSRALALSRLLARSRNARAVAVWAIMSREGEVSDQ